MFVIGFDVIVKVTPPLPRGDGDAVSGASLGGCGTISTMSSASDTAATAAETATT